MNSAILVAAGKGTRMGAGVDKLFLEVAGRPVVAHTWQRFDDAKCIGEIILVVREGQAEVRGSWRRNSISKSRSASSPAARSGRIRSGTVWRRCRPAAEVVAIHDAARPCVSGELIAATIERAAGNRRGGRGAAGDGHHQGIRRRQVD